MTDGKSSYVNGGFAELLSYTLETVKELADANSVVGDKIEHGNTAIIPVSKISVGFAGGGADTLNEKEGKRRNPAGTGAKISREPVTFIVMDDSGAHLMTVAEEEKPSKAAEAAAAAVSGIKNLVKKPARKRND